ncbi:MAG: HNH endonuclease, partial [Acidibrevibacterium sp.]|uniref:HNH endonuclease n=1 Tax=Acidibrevibacterium sp. TaxID=2606776 RepID=UPI003CFFAA4D
KRGWTAEWSADKSAARIIPTPGFTGKRVFDHLLTLVEDTAANEIVDDIKKIEQQTGISETTKKALIDARIGQGEFREELEKRWSQACSLTGCKIREILRASQIKPWKDSSDKERLDAENGRLLTANLDAAFDRGLISFSDQGEMLVSDQLSEEQRAELGIPRPMRGKRPTQKQTTYLRFHRKHWGFR